MSAQKNGMLPRPNNKELTSMLINLIKSIKSHSLRSHKKNQNFEQNIFKGYELNLYQSIDYIILKFIISNFQIKHVELYLEIQSIKYYIFFF
jgi:hypothetical protein